MNEMNLVSTNPFLSGFGDQQSWQPMGAGDGSWAAGPIEGYNGKESILYLIFVYLSNCARGFFFVY